MMIRIEALARAHLPLVQKYASHPSIGAASNVPFPYPANGASEWYEYVSLRINSGVAKVFAILCDGEICGVVSLNAINPEQRTAELDYWVAADYQSKGIATKAAAQAADFARDALGTVTLLSGCLLRNAASGRVLEKSGFEETARGPLPHGKFKGEVFRHFQRKLKDP